MGNLDFLGLSINQILTEIWSLPFFFLSLQLYNFEMFIELFRALETMKYVSIFNKVF